MTIPGFKAGWRLAYLFLFVWGGIVALRGESFEAMTYHTEKDITGTISGEYTVDSQRIIVRVKKGSYTWHSVNGVPRKKIVKINVWLARWKEDRSAIEYLTSSDSVTINKTVEDNETLAVGTYKFTLTTSQWSMPELSRMWVAICIADADMDALPGISKYHAFHMTHYLLSGELTGVIKPKS